MRLRLEKIIMFMCNGGSQGSLCGSWVLWICNLLAVSSLDDGFVVRISAASEGARKRSQRFWLKPDDVEESRE